MMKWVKSKFCVVYFIPGNNMMDHLIDTDLSYEIDALWRTSQSDRLITDVIDTCWKEELILANMINQIDAPAWLKRAYVIYQRIDNEHDYYTDLLRSDLTTDLPTDLQSELYSELSDIFKGLCFQQQSASIDNMTRKHIFSLKSESHLLLAVNMCESHERCVVDSCSRALVETMPSYFIFWDIDVSRGK